MYSQNLIIAAAAVIAAIFLAAYITRHFQKSTAMIMPPLLALGVLIASCFG